MAATETPYTEVLQGGVAVTQGKWSAEDKKRLADLRESLHAAYQALTHTNTQVREIDRIAGEIRELIAEKEGYTNE